MSKYTNGLIPTGKVAFTQASLPFTVPAGNYLVGNIIFSNPTIGAIELRIDGILMQNPGAIPAIQTIRLFAGAVISNIGGATCNVTGVLFTQS